MEPKYDNLKGTGHLPADERAKRRAQRAADRALGDRLAAKEPGRAKKPAENPPAVAPPPMAERHTRGRDK